MRQVCRRRVMSHLADKALINWLMLGQAVWAPPQTSVADSEPVA